MSSGVPQICFLCEAHTFGPNLEPLVSLWSQSSPCIQSRLRSSSRRCEPGCGQTQSTGRSWQSAERPSLDVRRRPQLGSCLTTTHPICHYSSEAGNGSPGAGHRWQPRPAETRTSLSEAFHTQTQRWCRALSLESEGVCCFAM